MRLRAMGPALSLDKGMSGIWFRAYRVEQAYSTYLGFGRFMRIQTMPALRLGGRQRPSVKTIATEDAGSKSGVLSPKPMELRLRPWP